VPKDGESITLKKKKMKGVEEAPLFERSSSVAEGQEH